MRRAAFDHATRVEPAFEQGERLIAATERCGEPNFTDCADLPALTKGTR